jgi:hypothetical protein
MELAPAVSAALAGDVQVLASLATTPASEWTKQAAQLVPVFERVLSPRELSWQQRFALQRVAKLPNITELVRLFLEPDSQHLELGLALAAAGRPNDVLEARLRDLAPSEAVGRALATASGEGVVAELAHSMGKPYVSPDVLESMRVALDDLTTLTPRQVGRHAPELISLLRNWQSVTGGDDASEQVYRALNRSDLPALIKSLEPLVAKDRRRWLELLKDLYFHWPSGATWAQNAIDFFDPTALGDDEDDASFDGDDPPPPVQAFRRTK